MILRWESWKDGSVPFVEFLSDVLDPPVMLVPGAHNNDTMLKGSQQSSYTQIELTLNYACIMYVCGFCL